MTNFITQQRINLRVFCAIITLAVCYNSVLNAQVTTTTGYSASQLAQKLAGPGVTILSPTLTCAGAASGEFQVVSSNLGINCGILLTSGLASGVSLATGTAESLEASTDNFAPGDADLDALSGETTFDACILEFNFIPSGGTVSFNYVFGSEEYTDWACTGYNDVFGFLITGPGFATPTNLALVPGTSIPVCINSVNDGPGTMGTLPVCSALGPGSPFSAYYVNNLAGTTITYDGFTTVLTAHATVAPCDTYHLKLGVADASDGALDSGVFLQAGSLSSATTVALDPIGMNGTTNLLRGCVTGKVNFTVPPHCTREVVRFSITGSAVNGYDYAPIPDSLVFLPGETLHEIDILQTMVPPTFPKIVTLTVLKPDQCNPDLLIPDPTEMASLTIYDTLHVQILTPDTTICSGDPVNLRVETDPVFSSMMQYTWVPPTALSSSTVLAPVASPTITTTYTISGNVIPGCPLSTARTDNITITVKKKPILSIDSFLVKTCVDNPVQLHVYAQPDTVIYDYRWTPDTTLSNAYIFNPIDTPSSAGDVVFIFSVYPTGFPHLGCTSIDSIKVHSLPDSFALVNRDTVICRGQSVQVSITGDPEFHWAWTPTTNVVSDTSIDPVITPSVTSSYSVTASYAHCVDITRSFNIEVDTPVAAVSFTDTICLGMTDVFNLAVTSTDYYHYQWTPPDFLSNDTIPNPVITPTVTGAFSWTVTIQPHAAACAIVNSVNILVLPNSFTISPTDTAICRGNSVQVYATPYPLFTYQWLPTAGIPLNNQVDPLITADTSALYVVTASFHRCPDMRDTLKLDVQPNPTVYIGGNRFMCEFDTIHVHAYVSPGWYEHYTYNWAPATDLDDTNTTTVVLTGDQTANLIVNVSTPAGCSAIDSALITVHPGNFDSLATVPPFCPHDTFVLRPLGAGVSYQWYPSMYISDSLATNPVISPITTQSYSVIATSQYGCKDTLYFEANVHSGAAIYLNDDSVTLHPGETYQINAQTNCTAFTWFPAAGLDDPYIPNPLANPGISTKYIVTGTTEWGCIAKDSIEIYVDPESVIAIPNAFTPGAGPNNEFKIIKQGIVNLKYFRIFNRWGEMLFETTDIDKGWDGTFNGTPQPFGVYVFQVQAVTSTGKIFEKHGNTTLIR